MMVLRVDLVAPGVVGSYLLFTSLYDPITYPVLTDLTILNAYYSVIVTSMEYSLALKSII